MSLPQFSAFSLSEGNLNLGPRWAKWLSRFNRLMVAMEIADPPRKQALLLHYAGPEIDEIYDTLPIEAAAADGSPIDTYESTANALTRYFTPKTNAASEIYNFRQAKQEATETIDAFVTRLRKLAKTCNFSNTDGEVTKPDHIRLSLAVPAPSSAKRRPVIGQARCSCPRPRTQ